MSSQRGRASWWAGWALALSCAGCAPLETRSPVHMANPFSPLSMEGRTEIDEEEDEIGIPETMAVIWTDSVYTAPGAQPTRGFGGRFYFYDQSGETIRVKGELSVFGFDDSSEESQSKVPQKKFVYTADQLQPHATMTDLGISYSFWIPWDAVGGERKAISLVPVFRPVEGKIVRGEQTINVLPGRTVESSVSTASHVNQIRQIMDNQATTASFTESNQAGYPVGLAGMPSQPIDPYRELRQRTSTIDVPRDLARSLQVPQSQSLATARTPNRAAQYPETPQPFVGGAMEPSGNSYEAPRQTGTLRHNGRGNSHGTPEPRSSYPNIQQPPTQQPSIQQPPTGMVAPGVGTPQVPTDIPFPTRTYDPSTRTMTGMGQAPGFGTGY
ncbi:MAG: hypothetical protein R3B96_18000 [Pirellulaceae bacterium]